MADETRKAFVVNDGGGPRVVVMVTAGQAAGVRRAAEEVTAVVLNALTKHRLPADEKKATADALHAAGYKSGSPADALAEVVARDGLGTVAEWEDLRVG